MPTHHQRISKEAEKEQNQENYLTYLRAKRLCAQQPQRVLLSTALMQNILAANQPVHAAFQ